MNTAKGAKTVGICTLDLAEFANMNVGGMLYRLNNKEK